ncbi:MAG TPA: tRNA (adenosine(37)-N6)-threonylcarbamoyltransferase complex ATPase subunit type 1 TsaE [Candidatus Binatia bacterium]|nr:tRNA (adenosine(37)-N6)-threonylcarbamoyltransferase complex ATPase subunit type 1 TsaE [Candidatus Binatia bacterium]
MTRSPRQTINWGVKLGKLLQGGEIIALIGELGTGKTCFVRGVTQGLDVSSDAWIRSPTFTLINEYHGRLPVYHIDLYRVETRSQLEGLNLREYLYSDGVSLIEWFDHLPADEVDEYLELRIAYTGSAKRELNFTPHGERYQKIIEGLKSQKLDNLKNSQLRS